MKADRAVSKETDDLLDRSEFVSTLASILVEPVMRGGSKSGSRSTGVVVGLTGSWGSGKSTILNFLKTKLESDGTVLVVNFNPWLLRDRDFLLQELFKSIKQKFVSSELQNLRAIADDIDKYWKAIDIVGYATAIGIDVAGTSGTSTLTWSRLSKEFRRLVKGAPVDLERARRELEQKIADADVGIVVLIDELDRVEDDEVREVARLIKAVGDIAGISYLVAYDPQRVADALGRGDKEERRHSGEAYLEKIIQYPIPIRPLWERDISHILDAMLDGHNEGLFSSSRKDRQRVYRTVVGAIKTPRDLKRLAGAFEIFWKIGRGEVCPIDVLAYSWIATKYPATRNVIATFPERFVRDPATTEEHFRRMGKKEALLETDFGQSIEEEVKPLLKCLFPSVTGLDNSHEWSDHNRLFYRRNLGRMLYFGDPPGTISRGLIEKLWNSEDHNSALTNINLIMGLTDFSQLIDRIDDLIVELPAKGDLIVLNTISNFWRRSEYYSIESKVLGISSREVSDIIVRLGLRDSSSEDRIINIINGLIGSDDFAVVPGFIRNELFAHQISKLYSQQEPVLSKKTINELWEKESARYRNSILNGSLLRDWCNTDPIFALLNCELWDEKLKKQLSKQINEFDALIAFSTIIVPPGHIIDLSTLEKMIEIEDVKKSIYDAEKNIENISEWGKLSFKRFKLLIEGKDLSSPDYIDY